MYPVAEGIFRGREPKNFEELTFLKKIGIKTVLDLEKEWGEAGREWRFCREAGINFQSLAMSAFWKPTEDTVDAAVATVADVGTHPILVHCKQGVDRTGLIIAMYRRIIQGWSKGKAYEEMLEHGFHRFACWGLHRYFWTH